MLPNSIGRYSIDERAFFAAELGGLGLETRGLKLLEIGFGPGAFLGWARDSGAIVVGVDIQSELVAAACSRGFEAYEHLEDVPKPVGGFRPDPWRSTVFEAPFIR